MKKNYFKTLTVSAGLFLLTAGNMISQTWSALGTGVDNDVQASVVYNGALYVGGSFTTAGGSSANRVAKWDGTAWTALGSGIGSGTVFALAVYNNDLYAAGVF